MIAACAGSNSKPLELEGTTWHLISADRGALVEPAAGSRVTMEFAGDRVSGFGGCNRYSGSFSFDGTTLRVGPLASTKMGCIGAAGDIEAAWHTALRAPLKAVREGANLDLTTADGTTLRLGPGAAPGA
jgi:heat shock protein HslJ